MPLGHREVQATSRLRKRRADGGTPIVAAKKGLRRVRENASAYGHGAIGGHEAIDNE
ncbi:MAG: hypothetical protein GXP28_03705 [Planctomycetes bacterium]|nr:hypothetical protein [Planctomycetota bacterium]